MQKLEGNIKVSVGVLLPTPTTTRTHILCFLALAFSFSHRLWLTARGAAWKSDPVASPCSHQVGGIGSKALVGLLSEDPLTRSSCRAEVSIPTSLLLPGAPPAGDL